MITLDINGRKVEADVEPGQVAFVVGLHLGDQLFLAAALLTRANHRGRAMRVVGAHVHAAIADELLEAHPDIGLNRLKQIPNVDIRVDVGQRRGDKDSTHEFGVR